MHCFYPLNPSSFSFYPRYFSYISLPCNFKKIFFQGQGVINLESVALFMLADKAEERDLSTE